MTESRASRAYYSRDRFGDWLRKYAIIVILFGMIGLLSVLTEGTFLQPQNLINVVRQMSVIAMLGDRADGRHHLDRHRPVRRVRRWRCRRSSPRASPSRRTRRTSCTRASTCRSSCRSLAGLGVGALCGFHQRLPHREVPDRPVHRDAGHADGGPRRSPSSTATAGRSASSTPEFNCHRPGRVLGIPVPILLLGVVVRRHAHLLLNNTRFGRYVYAIGGNEQAARVSGINLTRVKIGIYTFSGLLAGLGGMILAGRIGSGNPHARDGRRARRDHRRGHRRRELRGWHRHRLGGGRRGAHHRLAEHRSRPDERVAVLPAGRQGRDHRRRDHHRRAQEPLGTCERYRPLPEAPPRDRTGFVGRLVPGRPATGPVGPVPRRGARCRLPVDRARPVRLPPDGPWRRSARSWTGAGWP